MTAHTDSTFTFLDWDEHELGRTEGGTRLARATVRNTYTGAIEAAGTHCAYTIAYAPDGTGTFSGYQLFEGAVAGRKGGFAVREEGTFDERGTVRCSFEVVPGSGSGELAGLTGRGSYTAEHGVKAVPYRFEHSAR
ncbi:MULTISPECIES: DUF3224 domain-containing protein [Streptomyces]|uniref:DUF3224 domain-containing protein n=1 Tax=Streptomyces TaxID=1883 RepID=UPI00163BA947|nr:MULTISPECIES: DUF3224 domain-containing protein [Streptomyces]MBC2874138.1 DUF3224 domain-containing protein [Streptomyces sp. TYQ1024]UBI40188.1 DUF3224 domain-containing protein [Streptomyces mobaraensis]UKW32766.1 DUF3224 domain-containing protein [Streptomyces sp. TYQ1024]